VAQLCIIVTDEAVEKNQIWDFMLTQNLPKYSWQASIPNPIPSDFLNILTPWEESGLSNGYKSFFHSISGSCLKNQPHGHLHLILLFFYEKI